MSKLFDLLEISKELSALKGLIDSQEATVKFVESRLKNMSAIDDEEELKRMGSASAHDLKILKPHYDELKEKFEVLLEVAKADPTFVKEFESTKIPEEYKPLVEDIKSRISAEQGKERPQE